MPSPAHWRDWMRIEYRLHMWETQGESEIADGFADLYVAPWTSSE